MSARSLASTFFDDETRFLVHTERRLFAEQGVAGALRWNAMLLDAWVRERIARRRYVQLDAAAAARARKSDVVFVFGSGASLNELSPEEWAHFAAHDVFGFNAFYYQRWVPVDFHLLRVGIYGSTNWRPFARSVGDAIAGNSHFAKTIFVVQSEFLGSTGNQLLGYGLLPAGARVLRYHTARGDGLPHRDLRAGVRHGGGTLTDAVNVAYALGWTNIVLVGVDLYDSRYFYLPPDQTAALDQEAGAVVGAEYNALRGNRFDQAHATLRLGIVQIMEAWRREFERHDVRLSVYNPRSLLAEVLPVYRTSSAA